MTDTFDIRNSAFGFCFVPHKGKANFAWVQHFIHHLAPSPACVSAARRYPSVYGSSRISKTPPPK